MRQCECFTVTVGCPNAKDHQRHYMKHQFRALWKPHSKGGHLAQDMLAGPWLVAYFSVLEKCCLCEPSDYIREAGPKPESKL